MLAPVLIVFAILGAPNVKAMSNSETYMQGWFDGVNAAKNSEVSGCPSGHTDSYCNGFATGYASVSSNGNSAHNTEQGSANHTPQVTNSNQPLSSQNSGGTNATTPQITSGWQEYVVPLVNTHLGVFHNENGVFIPWRTLCNNTQQYLLKSCDLLINPDGSLTSDGDRAVGCIWNGAVLTGAGIKLHLPLGSIGNILGGLASLTGCGDIANINQIQSSPIVQSAQQFLH